MATTDEVKKIFNAYLDRLGRRKTPERLAILEEIYSRSDHFDVETLYLVLKSKNCRVSRATVYNTLDLLVECDLVARRHFGGGQTLYERSYGFKQHDHLICSDCGRVMEFCDPRVSEIQSLIGDLLQFDVHGHTLVLHGKCRKNDCPHRPAGSSA
ncbi:MAG: transcriptional repressor [Bacteroidia bacterium]|nr:transcriptional repressor [Bacteroidia bacterium]MDW8332959.1 transcriptional repressor [Bacteroidia bacterium]